MQMSSENNGIELGEHLSDSTRVWIYIADRELNARERQIAEKELSEFSRSWISHNKQLKARGGIYFHRLAVLAVDESMAGASGCSIDDSVRFLRKLGNQMGIDFFNRMQFAYLDEKGKLKVLSQEAFRKKYRAGEIEDDTMVLDPLVDRKDAFERALFKPLSDSWHLRFVQ